MIREYMIRLPWPHRDLSPNTRKKRIAVTGVRNAYKTACWAITKETKAEIQSDALLHITFYPPDNHRRDLDNMLGSIKYGLDGVALAAGVDDYGWSLHIERGPKVKGGAVLVHVKRPEKKVEIRGEIS